MVLVKYLQITRKVEGIKAKQYFYNQRQAVWTFCHFLSSFFFNVIQTVLMAIFLVQYYTINLFIYH